MYSVSAAIKRYRNKSREPDKRLYLDVTAIKDTGSEHEAPLLCSPNIPSGNLLDAEKIKSMLLQFHGLVILAKPNSISPARQDFFRSLMNSATSLYSNLFKSLGPCRNTTGMCFFES